MDTHIQFCNAVASEIEAAREHFPNQEENLWLSEWLSILLEEVGEVARSLNDGFDPDALRTELIQVAAMAGRMYAALDHRQIVEGGWSAGKPRERPRLDEPVKIGDYVKHFQIMLEVHAHDGPIHTHSTNDNGLVTASDFPLVEQHVHPH